MSSASTRVLGVLLLALLLYWHGRPNFHPLDESWQLARRWGLAESVVGKARRLAKPALHPEGWRDPRIEEASIGYEQWRLLLQIDTDDDLNMMWQDGGLLYFWIREEDAAKGNFGAAWMFLQSG